MQGSTETDAQPNPARELRLLGISSDIEIVPGTDLGALLAGSLIALGVRLSALDIIVVSQKVVSKAEGRVVDWRKVTPGHRARTLAEQTGKDPRLVELVLAESTGVVRAVPGVLIVRHRLGFTMANAGIDLSNSGGDRAILLPIDPDASAARIAGGIARQLGARPAVVISDSFGRPWRVGVTNVAIGVAGMPALVDWRGQVDRDGRPLEGTEVAVADAVAAAAGLLMGEANENVPAVLLAGLGPFAESQSAQMLVRSTATDLFQ